jgi:hypothetical protein
LFSIPGHKVRLLRWPAVEREMATNDRICVHALVQAERIHETRWLGGAYDRELQPILRAMAAVERRHGLDEDEFFGPDDAPDEWLELERHYETVLDGKLEGVLAELGLDDLLDLRRRDRRRFDRLREAGRLAFSAGTAGAGWPT